MVCFLSVRIVIPKPCGATPVLITTLRDFRLKASIELLTVKRVTQPVFFRVYLPAAVTATSRMLLRLLTPTTPEPLFKSVIIVTTNFHLIKSTVPCGADVDLWNINIRRFIEGAAAFISLVPVQAVFTITLFSTVVQLKTIGLVDLNLFGEIAF